MRKRILIGMAILAVIAIATFNVNLSLKQESSKISPLALANLEALSQNESGEGTSVGSCYLLQSFSDRYDWKHFCDSKTNNSTIYPCPVSDSRGGYSEMAIDRCTQ